MGEDIACVGRARAIAHAPESIAGKQTGRGGSGDDQQLPPSARYSITPQTQDLLPKVAPRRRERYTSLHFTFGPERSQSGSYLFPKEIIVDVTTGNYYRCTITVSISSLSPSIHTCEMLQKCINRLV